MHVNDKTKDFTTAEFLLEWQNELVKRLKFISIFIVHHEQNCLLRW